MARDRLISNQVTVSFTHVVGFCIPFLPHSLTTVTLIYKLCCRLGKTKALVAATHGINIDTAQQLCEYLREHHSELSSEQHERLHEVSHAFNNMLTYMKYQNNKLLCPLLFVI